MPNGDIRDIWKRINDNRDKIMENTRSVVQLTGKIDHLTEKAEDTNTKITCLDKKFTEIKSELTNNKINDVKTKAGLQVGYWIVRALFVAAISGLITLGVTYAGRFLR